MPRTSKLLTLLAAAISLATPTAAFATNVMGQLPGNTTWDPAGNPWTITGDLTVPAGVTLTIQPGTQVVFASGDAMGSGANSSRTELIVEGTLLSQGSAGSRVTLNASAGYGVRVLSGGTATLDYTDVSGHSSYYGVYSSGTFTANNSTITGGNTCLYVAAGNATFNSGTLKSCSYGVYTSGGNTSLAYTIIRGTSSYGVYATAPISLVHDTIANNIGTGVYIDGFTGSVTVRDNAIVSNGAYGLRFYSPSTPSRTVDHNDVWSNSSTNYSNVSAGTGSISENPIFVGGNNFAPTTNSPLRMAASDGTDIGAVAYAGAPTPDLRGVLYTNTTLTGANTVTGDLTVPAGVTLTLAPGATLTFASTDAQAGGTNSSRVELIVQGTLLSQGSAGSRVTLNASAGYGVRVLSGGTATLDYTDVSGHSSYYGVYSSGTFTAN
ncbi:MAG: right-handed parallel beta-helix repeat-containing protein, partial [Myxococcaceae bacterium]|nr:right-handed parallel beta-helix repeat-containing protein [Myxococcaceae bacterium]